MTGTKRAFLFGLIAVGFALAGHTAYAGEPVLVYDWDVLKNLPRKQLKTTVGEIDKKFFEANGVELAARAKPDPILIVDGRPYHGKTTYFAGMRIPEKFSQFQHIGKWTADEYFALVAELGVAYLIYDKNKGSSSAPRAPEQSASVTVTSGNRSASVSGCAGSANASVEDNESGSGKSTASCSQPVKQ